MDRAEVWWGDPPASRWPTARVDPDSIIRRADKKPSRRRFTRTVHQLSSEDALTRADGMPRDCVVNCDVLLTVPKSRFVARITKLSPAKMDEVHQAIRFALELP